MRRGKGQRHQRKSKRSRSRNKHNGRESIQLTDESEYTGEDKYDSSKDGEQLTLEEMEERIR